MSLKGRQFLPRLPPSPLPMSPRRRKETMSQKDIEKIEELLERRQARCTEHQENTFNLLQHLAISLLNTEDKTTGVKKRSRRFHRDLRIQENLHNRCLSFIRIRKNILLEDLAAEKKE